MFEEFWADPFAAPVLECSGCEGKFPSGLSCRQAFFRTDIASFIEGELFFVIGQFSSPHKCQVAQFEKQYQWAGPF